MRTQDPDVRGRCRLCNGPLYRDEEAGSCPDCRGLLAQIAAAHRPAPAAGPRLIRISGLGTRPRQRGWLPREG